MKKDKWKEYKNIPMGYKKIDGKLVINPEEEEIVKYIHKKCKKKHPEDLNLSVIKRINSLIAEAKKKRMYEFVKDNKDYIILTINDNGVISTDVVHMDYFKQKETNNGKHESIIDMETWNKIMNSKIAHKNE